MKLRNIFNFFTKKTTYQALGSDESFSYNEDLYKHLLTRASIDVIARNVAKLNVKHIVETDGSKKTINSNIEYLLKFRPNTYMNSYSFKHKIISELLLNNNSFIYVERDIDDNAIALIPLSKGFYELQQINNDFYLKFNSAQGEIVKHISNFIHLKNFFTTKDFMGDDNMPLRTGVNMYQEMKEVNLKGAKLASSLRGVLKTTGAKFPADMEKQKADFIQSFTGSSGFGALDGTLDFEELKLNPLLINTLHLKNMEDEIFSNFGVNWDILLSKYDENTWNAFYENVIVPIAIQLSQEFTYLLFKPSELKYGNQIIFEANKIEYASNDTKIKMVEKLNNAFTINEMRDWWNKEAIKDGDVRMQDLNHISSDIANEYQMAKMFGND